MTDYSKLSLDEQMTATLTLAKNALYYNGICRKLFVYLKHAERLVLENQSTQLIKQFDALDCFRDFCLRAQKKAMNLDEINYITERINQALE